jgi:hypothetical protein
MSRLFSKRNAIPFLVAMSLVLIPALSAAGGHGGGHGGGTSTYYPLRTYSSYYPTYAGTYTSGMGGMGHGGSSYNYGNYYLGGGSLGLYGGYSYPRTYSALSGYGLGGYGLSSLFGLGGYGGYSPLTQVSKDYSVEQSRTYYVPGGSVTNSVSESTEISSYRGLYGGGLYGGLYGGGLYGGLYGWY